MKKHKLISLFAGVGGIDLGFHQMGCFETVWTNEFDKNARKTYELNFSNKVCGDDIRNVNVEDVPDCDVLLSGFPCTSFSIAGYRKGFEDENTGDLFFETLRFIVAKKPKVVFLENVKNLVGHDKGRTFENIKESLKQNGYHLRYKVLNSKDYGNIPQNRERIYIVGFLDRDKANKFEFPDKINLEISVFDLLEDNKVDDKYYYTADNFKHYDVLLKEMKNTNSVYGWRRAYVRENKSGVCPTLTANMGTGGHNVPLIIDYFGIRKLTPRECFNLQGYPKDFKLPQIANG